MSSPQRRNARGIPLADRVETACRLRDEWLRIGLSTEPADRDAAEHAVTELYRLLGEPPPEFVWVPSPTAAAEVLRSDPSRLPDGLGRPDHGKPIRQWPLLQRLIVLRSEMRHRIMARIEPTDGWMMFGAAVSLGELTTMTPREMLDAGVSVRRVLEAVVHQPLRETLADSVYRPLRTALLGEAGNSGGIAGYERYDLWETAFFDICQTAGLFGYRRDAAQQLAHWAELGRSTGWWWPGPRRCVMAERPIAVYTEPQAGALSGEVRLHHDQCRAVEFADGAGIFVLHGTPVPEWVMTAPTIERIRETPSIEVRRAAIERIGWDPYIEQTGLTLLSHAPDPGNPGAELRLYESPDRGWRGTTRLLLVVNGSRERDGTRRRYGLNVPGGFDDALAAAGWTYGLSGAQYAELLRRT
ncbi:DUF6745 domain-containing protein [Nocardia sp. IFM 10818]